MDVLDRTENDEEFTKKGVSNSSNRFLVRPIVSGSLVSLFARVKWIEERRLHSLKKQTNNGLDCYTSLAISRTED